MSNQYQFHSTQALHSITHFLHHCSITNKNYKSIKKLHAYLLRSNLLFNLQNLQTKLIYSYTTCLPKNSLQILSKFFNGMNPTNPVPFNVLVSDFCRNGFPLLALHTFFFMHKNGVALDTYALCSSFKASFSVGSVIFGKQLHAHVVKSGWSCSVFLGSALIDLYAKSSLLNDAVSVFDEIPVKNTVCANALLSGYGEAKLWVEGLDLVREMPMLNLNYDHFTFLAMLRACAGLSAIELGRQVHANLIRTVYDVENDEFLRSALIEMYGKCGQVGKAWQVFNLAGFERGGESRRDVVLWTSMLGIYGKNGYFKEVIRLYKDMLMEGIRPDEVAFVTVISACGHTGQVKLGVEYFESMTRDFGLDPGPEHYSCLVDLLCRAGELDMAWKLVNEMPPKGLSSCSISMWGSLLNACMDRGNIDLGKVAAQRALEMDPHNAGIYILLSNMYARLGMWDEIEHLRVLMKEKELEKDVGCSRVDAMS